MIRITVNGQEKQLEQGGCVGTLLDKLEISQQNLALEINGEFLALQDGLERILSDGDRIEIVRFVGGG